MTEKTYIVTENENKKKQRNEVDGIDDKMMTK